MADSIFNEELLGQLNAEYASDEKKLSPNPPGFDEDERKVRATRTAIRIDKIVGLRGQRVLEIGCGMGDLSFELVTNYDAEVVGIDVRDLQSEAWEKLNHPLLVLRQCDISKGRTGLPENGFTRIISRAVWEHIRHPYTALDECRRILHPKGKKYLYANLYRSAMASHLYRHIDFPWPHLLFAPEVIASWFRRKSPEWSFDWSYWVNKLTYAQYLLYFKKLGFFVTYEALHKRKIDDELYGRFKDRLGLYPRFDLGLDFFEVVLEFDPESPKEPIPDPVYRIAPGIP